MIRAWRLTAAHQFVEVELPEPTLAGDQVLVEVHAAPLTEAALACAGTDRTPGESAVGTVTSAGSGAAEWLGARVALGPLAPCGECDVCSRGAAEACPGATRLGATADGTLASHVRASARWLCKLDGELDILGPEAALLGGAASTAYAMFCRAGVAPGELAVVLGEGTIARILLEIASAKGARPVLVREDAAGTARESIAKAAADSGCGERPWRIFETTAAPNLRSLGASLAGPAATLVLLSSLAAGRTGGADWRPSAEALLERGCTVLGINGAHPDLLPEVAALAVRGDIDAQAASALTGATALTGAVADLVQRDDASVATVVEFGPR